MPSHRIHEQLIELTIRGPEAEVLARGLQDRVSALQRRKLVEIIDRLCSERSPAGRIDRFDRLELELGVVDLDDFEADFGRKLEAALRRALGEAIGDGGDVGGGVGALADASLDLASARELIGGFARGGVLPWWADGGRETIVAEALRIVVAADDPATQEMLEALLRRPEPLARLLRAGEDRLLIALAERFGQALGVGLAALALALLELREGGEPGRAALRDRLWSQVLRACLRAKAEEPASLRASAREALIAEVLRARPGWSRAGLARAVDTRDALAWARVDEAIGVARRRSALVELGEALAVDTGAAAEVDDDRAQPESLLGARGLAGELLALLAAREGEEGGDSPQAIAARMRAIQARALQILAGQLDGDPNAEPDAGSVDGARSRRAGDRGAVAPGGADLDAGAGGELLARARELARDLALGVPARGRLQAHLAWLRASAADALPPQLRAGLLDALGVLLSRTLAEAEARRSKTTTVDEEQGGAGEPRRAPPPDAVPVNDAGLVILWPFLERLLQRTELVLAQTRTFADRRAQTRAVHLLHHLATAELGVPEFVLPLAKVLCGLDPADVLEALDPRDPQDLEPALLAEGEHMLTAVIAHAEILRELSAEGLRASFLRRPGLLSERDGAWLLQVEGEAHDLVLDRVPWSWTWLTLPWMATPLRVEW